MLEINCAGCVGCCSSKLPLTPVLWPEEEHRFNGNAVAVNTAEGTGYLLRRKENGNCIFLNEINERCAIYGVRPAECRIYPLLLDFSEFPKVTTRLDRRFCQHLNSLSLNNKAVEEFIRKFTFTEQFKRIYEALEGC